jgi:hypothetical protein
LRAQASAATIGPKSSLQAVVATQVRTKTFGCHAGARSAAVAATVAGSVGTGASGVSATDSNAPCRLTPRTKVAIWA